MDIDFSNKVVLVTGASAGIGESIALLFAKYGAQLVLVGRNEQNLLEVAGRCEKEKGIKPLAIVADLGTDEGCSKTANQTLERFHRLDVLVNNAGVAARTNLQQTDMASFDHVFNINVRGVYNLTRQLAPALIKSKGNIVNISSITATMVVVGSLPYGMAKAALDHFTRLVALELAPLGVRCNTVSPGFTVSKIIRRLNDMGDEEYDEFLANARKVIPMGEVCVGDDTATLVLHLASDLSRMVTGAIVQVDGGARFGSFGNILTDQIKN